MRKNLKLSTLFAIVADVKAYLSTSNKTTLILNEIHTFSDLRIY